MYFVVLRNYNGLFPPPAMHIIQDTITCSLPALHVEYMDWCIDAGRPFSERSACRNFFEIARVRA